MPPVARIVVSPPTVLLVRLPCRLTAAVTASREVPLSSTPTLENVLVGAPAMRVELEPAVSECKTVIPPAPPEPTIFRLPPVLRVDLVASPR